MFDYFKNIIEKNSCQQSGACSVHPSVNSLYEILLSEVREISFYLVKLKEFGMTNQDAMDNCLDSLSIFMINTSFNQEKYLLLMIKLYRIKKETKEKYLSFCSQNHFPCETIKTEYEIDEKTSISDLIKKADVIIANKQKNNDKKKQRLFELITIFSRLCAINIQKIKKYDPNYNCFDYEVIRFFALTGGYFIRNEKIIRRIKEFCKISKKIREKLYYCYKEKYGEKQSTTISTTDLRGHCILVSGNDLNELENLLKSLEEMNLEENINVYTNGALFCAHFFPFFQNNKFLKGHYGINNTQYDFSTFPGPILLTKNFIQKIDNIYRGEIFSNKIISFIKVFDVENQNYTPLIETSLKMDGFFENKQKENIKIEYDILKINEILQNFEQKEVIIITGDVEKTLKFNEYQNKKVINISCHCEVDILVETIKIIKEKNINTTIFFQHCNLESLEAIFSLLDENMKIYINNCYYVLINPHVIESLKEDFGVEII